jgi:NADP-dependent 3-hydroxy acid dehydrogenase YdfG
VKQFQNKVVWITGATSGIGEAVAKAFSASGAVVIISSRRREELERDMATCIDSDNVHVFPLDLTDAESIKEVSNEVLSKFQIDM